MNARQSAADAAPMCSEHAMSHRLACGRTLPRYLELLSTQLLCAEGENPLLTSIKPVTPRQGLFARSMLDHVLIVDTFRRRGVDYADVAPMVCDRDGPPEIGDIWKLQGASIQTCRSSDLTDVGLNFRCLRVASGGIEFCKTKPQTSLPKQISYLCTTQRVAKAKMRSGTADTLHLQAPETESIIRVMPQAALVHQETSGHRVVARCRRPHPTFLLDFPVAVELDMRPCRCKTCAEEGGQSGVHWMPVTDEDVRQRIPEVIIHRTERHGVVYFTRKWLLHLLGEIYSLCNMRAVRRSFASACMANAVSLLMGPQGVGSPERLPSLTLESLPKAVLLRSIALRAFTAFVRSRVRLLERRQQLYNGQVIRTDGNWDLARRIVNTGKSKKRPYTAMMAMCGVDGSLLSPVVARRAESWPELCGWMRPYLESLRDTRQAAGFSLVESMPVAHATDTYGKHRKKIRQLYSEVWALARLQTQSCTPRGDAVGVRVEATGSVQNLLTVTGDPLHDVLALRRCAAPQAADCIDFSFDHADLMNRLSAPCRPREEPAVSAEITLSAEGQRLLCVGVQESASAFKRQAAQQPEAAASLAAFLQCSGARSCQVWQQLFGASPPRGVVARLARRLIGKRQMRLPADCEFHNYATKAEFRSEIRRMRDWYSKQRRSHRRRKGIIRDEKMRRRTSRTVWSPKVEAHYNRLVKWLRIEGLWNWRRAALAIRSAGIEMQTGTVAVERLWASLLEYMPRAARTMTEPWFRFISDLMFLRYNYRHFHSGMMPPWADGDALLAERLQNLQFIARAVADGQGDDLLAEVAREYQMPETAQRASSSGGASAGNAPMHPATGVGEHGPPGVWRRLLQPQWAEALASGQKWVETQGFASKSNNPMRFATSGCLAAFGACGSDSVFGVCVLEGSAVRNQASASVAAVFPYVADQHRVPLKEYIQKHNGFDYVVLSEVFDLRDCHLTWSDLQESCGCSKVKQGQGWPRLGDATVAQRVLRLCQERGVRRSRPKQFGSPQV